MTYDQLFRGYDRDGDGEITFKEYLQYHLGIVFSTEELFDIVFAMYDADGNGYISRQELVESLTAAGDAFRRSPWRAAYHPPTRARARLRLCWSFQLGPRCAHSAGAGMRGGRCAASLHRHVRLATLSPHLAQVVAW